MLETLGFEDTSARTASVWLALGLGLAFGILAERTGFCFRRALLGQDRRQAAGVWLIALAVAVLGTQAAVAVDLISFDDHRFLSADLPVLAVTLGGLAFGAGMVLTRGCASRLTVLAGTGNLRALTVIVVFAIVAHATLKGVLSPFRTALGSVTIPLDDAATLAILPGGAWAWASVIAVAAVLFAIRSGNRFLPLAGGALIGVLAVVGWVGTGFMLLDDFDPIAMETLSFTSPASEALFYTVASTAIPAGFGTALIGGVLLGGLLAALVFGSFRWQSFESPRQTGRYLTGAMLMGLGGVLAGGCTVGAGLSGVSTLSIAAILALASIAAGALCTNAMLTRFSGATAKPATRPSLQPAE